MDSFHFTSLPKFLINLFHKRAYCDSARVGWVLHIAKVGSIPSPYLSNVEEQKS